MNPTSEIDRRYAILALRGFVETFWKAGVRSIPEFNKWKKDNIKYMETAFGYEKKPGMPPITGLVKAFFHPKLPLVGLNYTQLAHNTLHEFPSGWTAALRLCRGIIFDNNGDLVAIPFPKFFNFGEHPEAINIPGGNFEATCKQDGHLGIIFKYRHHFILTTRGSFESPSAKLGQWMISRHANKWNWQKHFPTGTTVLVEIIHPRTQVYVDYGIKRDLMTIGAYRNSDAYSYNYNQLDVLSRELNLSVTPIWTGESIRDLRELMRDRTQKNQEGYVVQFQNGLRVKFKFETYIGLMVEGNLSSAYLMQRILTGNLEKMLLTLPEEIYDTALRMLGEIMLRISTPGEKKDKWRRLYDLPHTTSDEHFKGICRKLVHHMLVD